TQQVTDHCLQHVNISVDHHFFRFHLVDSYLLQACHHTENLNDTVCHFDEVHILINHVQLTDLTLCPFQQVIQQREHILCCLIGHRQKLVHFDTYFLSR